MYSPKDKFVVTVCALLYLFYPTSCSQAFELFRCHRVGGELYLFADLEEPCWEGRHLAVAVVLGGAQLLLYVAGLPLSALFFMRRNRETLHGHVPKFRYGLFFLEYRKERWYWEIVVVLRKAAVVALGVFGDGGTSAESQAHSALLLLALCGALQAVAGPFPSTSRHRVLSVLEMSSLGVLWLTMWSGLLYFRERAQEVLLSVFVVGLNAAFMIALLSKLLGEYANELRKSNNPTAQKVLQWAAKARRSVVGRRPSESTVHGVELAAGKKHDCVNPLHGVL